MNSEHWIEWDVSVDAEIIVEMFAGQTKGRGDQEAQWINAYNKLDEAYMLTQQDWQCVL